MECVAFRSRLGPVEKFCNSLRKVSGPKDRQSFPTLLFVELRAASSSPYGVPLECLYGSRPRVKGGCVGGDGHHRSNSPDAKEMP